MIDENIQPEIEEVDHTPIDRDSEPVVVEQAEPEDEEKKELKSKYRRESRNRKKLERELSEIKAQVSELRTGHVGSAINGELSVIGQEYAKAEQAYHAAVGTADPTAITIANRNLMEKYTRWILGQQRAEQIKAQQQQRQQPTVTDPLTVRQWKQRNDWYNDPEYSDESEMAAKIDARLATEWDDEVGSQEYLDELDRRLSKKLPHLYNKGRGSSSQNVAGSSRTGSPTRVTLPRELIEAARSLGRPVDDPQWRKNMVEKYMRKN